VMRADTALPSVEKLLRLVAAIVLIVPYVF
jgi:hypothetical protein